MQCCNSFRHWTYSPPNPHRSRIPSTNFCLTQKCHLDKLFTQNKQMCNQTALYATPQQITRLVFTEELHLKQCKLTDKKNFFYFWRYCVVTVPLLPMHTFKTYLHKDIAGTIKIATIGAYIWVLDPKFEEYSKYTVTLIWKSWTSHTRLRPV